MADAAKTIETKTKSFAAALTKAMGSERAAAVKALAKKKKIKEEDADKLVVAVSFDMEKTKETLGRTPEQQAKEVAEGDSWTCASAHMVDKARHVLMKVTPAGGKTAKVTWKLSDGFGSKEEHFMTESAFKTEFGKQMKSEGLKNANGGDGYDSGDGFHLELPDGKLLRGDKAVVACMVEYARLTRIEGMGPNTKFENNWKSDLKPHIDAAEAEAKKIAEKKRKEEMKKLRFDGSIPVSVTLARGLNKNATLIEKKFDDIQPPSPLDAGSVKTRAVKAANAAVWDSLSRDIFEKIGLLPTKGFDVKVLCGIEYQTEEHEFLTQTFLNGLQLSCVVYFNTPAAPFMGLEISAKGDISLTKSGSAPKGSVSVLITLTTPLDKEQAEVVFAIDGGSVKSSVKM